MKHLGKLCDDMMALIGEVVVDLHEMASGMGKTVGQHRLHVSQQVGGESVAHVDGCVQVFSSSAKQDIKVLTGMSIAREEQSDSVFVGPRDDPCCE